MKRSDEHPIDPAKAGAAAAATSEAAARLGQTREEVGGAASSAKRPPHVTASDSSALTQEALPAPDPVPVLPAPDPVSVLPADSSGQHAPPTHAQDLEIDDESMYDGRLERHKDYHPSERLD